MQREMDHFNKSLTALASLDHQCFWEKKVNGENQQQNKSLVIAHLLSVIASNKVARFWVFAGEPLIVSIQHCQLRDGRQNKINFPILLFFFIAAN